MKIGLVCPYNVFKGGGVQECVLALQKGLSDRGHEVHIITPTPRQLPDKLPASIVLLGSSTDVKSPFHTTAQVSVSVKPDVLQKTLDTYRFDVLHFHEPWVPIVSRQILVKSQAKNIATFHAKLPDTIMSRTIERVITPYTRSILKYIDVYTAVSSAAAEYVQSLTNHKINIIPNGIDLDLYGSTTKKPKPGTILYIGRLEKRKGVKYLIKAYAELAGRHPDTSLIIAGDGPDREKLETYVNERNIPNVIFKGYISDVQKHELLASSAVFCSPALFGESFGIVLLEAMAYGLPIVAGDNPGYRVVLKEQTDASLVNPKQTAELAQKLEALLFDEPLRKQWQSWAKKNIHQYSYDHVVDQYEALYKKALG